MRLFKVFSLLLTLGVVFSFVSSGQKRDSRPTFEVASIRPVKRESAQQPVETAFRRYPARIDYSWVAIEQLVRRAYDLPPYPASLRWSERLPDARYAAYSIAATFPEGTTEAQIRQMLQRLLEDRLGLRTHREKTTIPGYEMTIAPAGIKLLRSKYEDTDDPDGARREERFPYSMPQGRDFWRVKGVVTVSKLASLFGGRLGVPMMDKTGIGGYYDVDFTWNHPFGAITGAGQPPTNGEAPIPEQSKPATLIPAVEKQLGLRIKPAKITFDVLTVDSIEKIPTPN